MRHSLVGGKLGHLANRFLDSRLSAPGHAALNIQPNSGKSSQVLGERARMLNMSTLTLGENLDGYAGPSEWVIPCINLQLKGSVIIHSRATRGIVLRAKQAVQ